MAIDDFLNASTPPPVGPEDLGVSPLPTPPVMPQAPQPKGGTMQMLLQALPGILGGAMGPGAGTGLLQGYVQGERVNEGMARQRYQDELGAYQMQQRAYDQQAQQHAIESRQREQILQQNLQALRNQVKDMPDKAAYDAYIEAYGNGLQSMGYRLDANWLRRAVPYVAPNREKQALDLWTRWKDANQKNFEADPTMAERSLVPFDRDGDGITEQVSIQELGAIAGVIGRDSDGKPVTAKPGQVQATKTRKDTIFNKLLAQAKAEHKDVSDPQLLADLNDQADRQAQAEDLAEWKTKQTFQEGLVRGRPEKPDKASDVPTSDYAGERGQRIVDAVNELLPNVNNTTVGVGSYASSVRGTPAYNFRAQLDSLKSNIAFNELAAMRAASKTGGALGAVSERELTLLESALGALDQGQSPGQFKAQLQKVTELVERWRRRQLQNGAPATPPASPSAVGVEEVWERGPDGKMRRRP